MVSLRTSTQISTNKVKELDPYIPTPSRLWDGFQEWRRGSSAEEMARDAAKGFVYGSAAALYTAAWIFAPGPMAVAHVVAACTSATTKQKEGGQDGGGRTEDSTDAAPFRPDTGMRDEEAMTNQPPRWLDLPHQFSFPEGYAIAISLLDYVRDPEHNFLTFSIYNDPGYNLPRNAKLQEFMFLWNTGFDQAGTYSIKIYVGDGLHDAVASVFNFEITNKNRPPHIDIHPTTNAPTTVVYEGESMRTIVTATDPDGDNVVLGVQNPPAGSTFDPHTGDFHWLPDYKQAGEYNINFTATDGELRDAQSASISVRNANSAPMIVEPSQDSFEVSEGEKLVIDFVAYDREGDNLTFEIGRWAGGPPIEGAILMQTGSQTAKLEWTPWDHQQSFSHSFWVTVDDGSLKGHKNFSVLVNDVP